MSKIWTISNILAGSRILYPACTISDKKNNSGDRSTEEVTLETAALSS